MYTWTHTHVHTHTHRMIKKHSESREAKEKIRHSRRERKLVKERKLSVSVD